MVVIWQDVYHNAVNSSLSIVSINDSKYIALVLK